MKALKIGALIVAALIMGGCSTLPFEVEVRKSDRQRLRLNPSKGAERLFSPAPHNFRQGFADQGDPVRRGNRSERFELRDRDCGGSDCGNPRARAEIQTNQTLGKRAIGKDIWYSWSFYNENIPSFDKSNSLRLVLGQWTKGGSGQPIIRLIQLGKGEGDFAGCDPKVCATKNNASGDVVVQLKDIATGNGWGDVQNNGYVCQLFDLEKSKGRWVDITMQTNFSAADDGYVRIWIDGRLSCDYAGPVVSFATINNRREIMHRRGIYSSWTRRWDKAQEGLPRPTLVAYYDEFKSGERRTDVDIILRQNEALAPLD